MMNDSIRGDRIRTLRERLGWSQGKLAEMSGIGIQQIHRYESGKADPSTSALKAVAQQLGVTTDYLVGLSDDPGGYGVMQLDDDTRRLVEAFKSGDTATMLRLIVERLPNTPPDTSQE